MNTRYFMAGMLFAFWLTYLWFTQEPHPQPTPRPGKQRTKTRPTRAGGNVSKLFDPIDDIREGLG